MADSDDSAVRLPDKLYFRIGEVAQLTGLPSHVLRFWETEFPAIRPKRTDAGQRLYRKADVELILTIRHLLHEKKFTIRGARQFLKTQGRREDAGDWVEIVKAELKAIRDLLE
ncbi:MAG: MerR family transcriptional regulator [Desulfobacterales bacterium]